MLRDIFMVCMTPDDLFSHLFTFLGFGCLEYNQCIQSNANNHIKAIP